MQEKLISGYQLRVGSSLDRALLTKFMARTYGEIYPDHSFAHLATTVEQYFSQETPVWWVEVDQLNLPPLKLSDSDQLKEASLGGKFDRDPVGKRSSDHSWFGSGPARLTVGCLWMGSAIDQVSGDRHAYVFLLYVSPEHRRQGIGKALMNYAEKWAQQRGDRMIGLQVFLENQPAVNLYQKLGYQTRSLLMVKHLSKNND